MDLSGNRRFLVGPFTAQKSTELVSFGFRRQDFTGLLGSAASSLATCRLVTTRLAPSRQPVPSRSIGAAGGSRAISPTEAERLSILSRWSATSTRQIWFSPTFGGISSLPSR